MVKGREDCDVKLQATQQLIPEDRRRSHPSQEYRHYIVLQESRFVDGIRCVDPRRRCRGTSCVLTMRIQHRKSHCVQGGGGGLDYLVICPLWFYRGIHLCGSIFFSFFIWSPFSISIHTVQRWFPQCRVRDIAIRLILTILVHPI